ncbi:MAG: rhodanese-like domain-containing protein [Candidatus Bathyarchaeota archaeon]|nr:rhodanese-like domain-containing protein [Candidatus Bathyarchaeota archaeon]
MELPYMDTVYVAFGLFLLITAYNYLKPNVERNYTGFKTGEAWDFIKSTKDVTIIDVRDREEYRQNHIKGARNIPLDQLDKRKGTLPRDKPVIVYCQNGGRSARAMRMLELAGFTKLYHMDEGLRGWTRAGHPTTRGK